MSSRDSLRSCGAHSVISVVPAISLPQARPLSMLPHRAYACVPSGNMQKVSGAVELLEEDAESEVHTKG